MSLAETNNCPDHAIDEKPLRSPPAKASSAEHFRHTRTTACSTDQVPPNRTLSSLRVQSTRAVLPFDPGHNPPQALHRS